MADQQHTESSMQGPANSAFQSPQEGGALATSGQSWRKRIFFMYARFNPTQLAQFDRLMEKYAGMEDALFNALVNKYLAKGVENSPLTTLVVTAANVPEPDPFALLRSSNPPWDPASVAALRSRSDWKPCSNPETKELAFFSSKLDECWEAQVWEWFGALALAGVKEEHFYAGTSISTDAFLKGERGTPAVRWKKFKVTINWFLNRDGRIRVDGPVERVEAALVELRRSHSPYVQWIPAPADGAAPTNVATLKRKRQWGEDVVQQGR